MFPPNATTSTALQHSASLEVQQLSSQAGAYHDVHQLQNLRAKNLDDPATLVEISRQFESMLAQQMLKSMRSANKIWSDGGLFNSDRVDFYQQMLDDQMSVELTRGSGLGLAEQFQRDLDQRFNNTHRADGETKIDQGLSNARRLSLGAIFPQPSDVVNRADPTTLQHVAAEPTEFSSPYDFVHYMRSALSDVASDLGVDVDALVAQAALESGWGEHVARSDDGRSSFNLFGIKANAQWQGETVEITTLEYFSNTPVRVQDNFRAYQSYAHSVSDYAHFIQAQPRYQQALHDTDNYPEQLQRAGYATDPDYADKIRSIMSRIADIPRDVVQPAQRFAMTEIPQAEQ